MMKSTILLASAVLLTGSAVVSSRFPLYSRNNDFQPLPNIIFLVCESTDGRTWQRGYQDDVIPLPNLRKLEDDGGISFYRHYSNSPVCCPSRATFWSGKHAHKIRHKQRIKNNDPFVVNGVWNNFEGLDPSYNHTIFDILQLHGYATYLSGKQDYVTGGHSSNVRFDAWTMYTDFPYDIPSNGGWREETDMCLSEGIVHEQDDSIESKYWHGDWESLRETIDWITNHTKKSSDKPFFAYQGMNIVHPQYVTNQRYYSAVDPNKIKVPEWINPQDMHPCDLQASMLKGCFAVNASTNTDADIERRRRIRRIYYAMISEFDAMVGRYVDAVQKDLPKEVADNTVFIVTSDHGDMQMEHHQFYKQAPYDASSSVPLLIYDPRRRRRHQQQPDISLHHQIVSHPTQLIDLFPTIMDLAMVPLYHRPSDLDGHSLLPLIDSDYYSAKQLVKEGHLIGSTAAINTRPNFVVSQYHGDLTAMSWFLIVETFPCVAFDDDSPKVPTTDRECAMKYIVWGTGTEVENMLFDLTHDADELVNLINDPKYAMIRQLLDEHLKSIVEYKAVAEEVATYNHQSFQRWVNVTSNWKDILASKSLRWHISWEEAGNDQAIAAVNQWISEPPQVKACRKHIVWPTPAANSEKWD
ncbi:choline-sulfatase [Nitzschia inconspicua]|uniref:Choline-sulfatase n=1 Tax=Nitzschia inconspicua TaxID=303405 RepID=A0A9K3KVP7_9STRA|nr:choline-sulfatase [Nitzschia inconspicua]